MRRNVEYYPGRLFKRYPCEFRRIEAHEDVDPAIDALVHLHGARWQASGYGGAFSSGDLEPFLREAAHDSFSEGRLRLWVLKIAGQTQAVLLGFLDNGVMHYFQKGFNPAFANEDLGTAVVALCVRDCFDDPQVRSFDFMGGGAAYKVMWARVARQTDFYGERAPAVGSNQVLSLGRAGVVQECAASVAAAVRKSRAAEAAEWLCKTGRIRRSAMRKDRIPEN
jgi:CelD/BcsL family acetyltransferase involved in cellulose biosynthesis